MKREKGIPVEISVIFPFSNEIKQKRPFLFHGGLFGKGLPPSLKQFSAFWSAGMHEFELRKFSFFRSLPPLSLWFVIVEEEEELLFSFRTQAKKNSVLSSPFSLPPFFRRRRLACEIRCRLSSPWENNAGWFINPEKIELGKLLCAKDDQPKFLLEETRAH